MSRQYYNPPQELPAGLLETLQPLASWVKAQLTNAYMAGYRDGRGGRRPRLCRDRPPLC